MNEDNLLNVLNDCIFTNQKLNAEVQKTLSAWVETAIDFGNNLNEAAEKIDRLELIIDKLKNCRNCKYYTKKLIVPGSLVAICEKKQIRDPYLVCKYWECK